MRRFVRCAETGSKPKRFIPFIVEPDVPEMPGNLKKERNIWKPKDSIDKYEYNFRHELLPESVFKTKDGRMLHSIDVHWNDFGFRYNGDNLRGITFDSEASTSEIYIQLIDENPGEPHDSAFVYKWDGSCFNYAGLQPATFPPYKDL